MTQSKPLVRLLLLTAVWTLTAGANSCSSGDSGPTFVTDLVLKDAAGAVRQEFARGESITLELTVRNRRDSETVVQFPSGQQSDFVVVDAGTSRVRWKWSHDRAFIQIVTEVVFAPGETKILTTVWNQLDDTGQAVGPGNYEARGVLLFPEFVTDPLSQHQLGSPLRPFTIT